jgi:hypothetical protein
METATAHRPVAEAAPAVFGDRRIPRLGARARKVTLIVHLASAAAWLGMDVVLGVLVVGGLGATPQVASAMAVAIGAFIGWPIVAVALLTLGSGVVLAVGSKYGLLRTWWVIVKLVLTLVLIVLVLVLLVPSVAELATEARTLGDPFTLDQQMLFPPVVSSSALLFAMALSVIKPWGRRR